MRTRATTVLTGLICALSGAAGVAGAAASGRVTPGGVSPAVASTTTGVTTGAPARTRTRTRRVAADAANRGILRRTDLPAPVSQEARTPARVQTLACRVDHQLLVAVGSPTWSVGQLAFASGTSYGFSTPGAAAAAWSQTASAAFEGCLRRQLASGTSQGVVLAPTAVGRLAPLPLTGGQSTLRQRHYRVSGTANGNGQQLPVTLDIVILSRGNWIGEDQFSAKGGVPDQVRELQATRRQAQRVLGHSQR